MPATSRASPGHDQRQDPESGMVTVEAAIALCAFVTVLAMVLAGASMVLDQIRCTDAAREAARLVARGEQNRAPDAVRQIAPSGATLAITTNGDEITATVQDPAAGGLLPGIHIHADAYAVREPDTAPTTPDSMHGHPTNNSPTTTGQRAGTHTNHDSTSTNPAIRDSAGSIPASRREAAGQAPVAASADRRSASAGSAIGDSAGYIPTSRRAAVGQTAVAASADRRSTSTDLAIGDSAGSIPAGRREAAGQVAVAASADRRLASAGSVIGVSAGNIPAGRREAVGRAAVAASADRRLASADPAIGDSAGNSPVSHSEAAGTSAARRPINRDNASGYSVDRDSAPADRSGGDAASTASRGALAVVGQVVGRVAGQARGTSWRSAGGGAR